MRNSKFCAPKKPTHDDSSSRDSVFFHRFFLNVPSLFASCSRLPPSGSGKTRLDLLRCLFFGARLGPEPNQQFGEVFHAGALEPVMFRGLLERLGHRTAFLVVPPKLGFNACNRNMVVWRRFRERLQLRLPKVSLFSMPLQIIEHALFAPIQTHAANVRRASRKTTAKPALTKALQSNFLHG